MSNKMTRIALVVVSLALLFICAYDLIWFSSESKKTPQEKVSDLAKEIKHENSAACVVLFTLSGSMLQGDEKRLASIMGIYAQTMKDSLEGLIFKEKN